MTTALLLCHAVLAVALIGAISHQVLVLWRTAPLAANTFFARLGNVRAGSYANAIAVLYALEFVLGAIIYPAYRVEVRPYLEDIGSFVAAGSFETKEHVAALGLGLLPAYWLFWKAPRFAAHAVERKYITLLLAFFVWLNFIVGHVVNNIHGLP